MFASAEPLGDDRYRVSLDAERRLDIDGDYNRSWNLRTLNLMARAGLIDLEESRPTPAPDDPDAALPPPPTRVIATRDSRHLDPALWDSEVARPGPPSARTPSGRSRRCMRPSEGTAASAT